MKDFRQYKNELDKELSRLTTVLNELLPRYSDLLNSQKITQEEITELGEIEHYLIGVNATITSIKTLLEHDLYGYSLDMYYKLKRKAVNGDKLSALKAQSLRENFGQLLKDGLIFNMN